MGIDERYTEWLAREEEIVMEEAPEVWFDERRLRTYLEEKGYTETQIDTLVYYWESYVEWEWELPETVRQVWVRYPWGLELRFAIKGRRGLFKAESLVRLGLLKRLPWEE